jgi:hypothetical protein
MKKINLIQAIFKTVNILKSVCPEYDDENDYFKEFWIIYRKVKACHKEMSGTIRWPPNNWNNKPLWDILDVFIENILEISILDMVFENILELGANLANVILVCFPIILCLFGP